MADSWEDFRRDRNSKRQEEERERLIREELTQAEALRKNVLKSEKTENPEKEDPSLTEREPLSAEEGLGEEKSSSDSLRKQRTVRKTKASVRKSKRTPKTEAAPTSAKALRRRRKRLLRVLVACVVLVIAIIVCYYYTFKRTYHGYKVLRSSEQEDTISTRYEPMGKGILKYSQDGLSVINRNLETEWSSSYDMSNPTASIRGGHCVIADKDGTLLVMADEDGVTGTVTTSYTIVKACVSKSGLVAAILDGGGDTWINFYGYDGSLIAENQTTLEDPGYPLDVSLSDNGTIMMVSYQFIDGSKTTSYVAFYNFGDVGQNADDRIVSGFKYEGHVIPQIECLTRSHSVAFRDDGFIVYAGSQIPDESEVVTVDKEIVSTFYDDSHIGLVFKNEDKERHYTMEVYGLSGDLIFSKDFNIDYTSIGMSGGYVIMYNSSQLCVITGKGDQRFNGVIDGVVGHVSKIGLNKYLLVLDTGVYIMKLT